LNQFISLLHPISLAPRFNKVFQIVKTIFKGINWEKSFKVSVSFFCYYFSYVLNVHIKKQFEAISISLIIIFYYFLFFFLFLSSIALFYIFLFLFFIINCYFNL